MICSYCSKSKANIIQYSHPSMCPFGSSPKLLVSHTVPTFESVANQQWVQIWKSCGTYQISLCSVHLQSGQIRSTRRWGIGAIPKIPYWTIASAAAAELIFPPSQADVFPSSTFDLQFRRYNWCTRNFKARKIQLGTITATSKRLSWRCCKKDMPQMHKDDNHDNDKNTQKTKIKTEY